VVGAGAETAIAPRWTAGLEYLYIACAPSTHLSRANSLTCCWSITAFAPLLWQKSEVSSGQLSVSGGVMRSWFLAAIFASLAAFTGSADAADLPLPYKAPQPVVPAFSWTGFYGGVNLGGSWPHGDNSGTLSGTGGGGGTFAAASTSSADLSGVIGGGQIGYNWQTGHLVLGLEADIEGSSASATGSVGCGIAGCSMTGNPKVDALGTLRGRVGYAADSWLFYVTGGFAWEHITNTVTDTTGLGTATLFSTSTTQGGYVVGIGAETAFAPHWTAGLEYLHIDPGTFTLFSGPVPSSVLAIFGAGGGATATINDSARMQNNIMRARLNYRFQ